MGKPGATVPLPRSALIRCPIKRRLSSTAARAAQAYVRHNGLDRVVGAEPGARLGVVCAGKTYFDVIQAFADLGLSLDDLAGFGVRILKLAMTYPLVEETIVEFAASVDELVVEEKRPFIETQLRSILHEAERGASVRQEGSRETRTRVFDR